MQMSAQPSPWSGSPPDKGSGGDGLPPIELYKIAVEEYRFQAQYNWSRTQYLLAFNAAILAAGVGLRVGAGAWAVLVFLLGIAASVATIVVMRTQHGYYRAARDRLRGMEQRLGVPEAFRVDTTATLGGRTRKVSVTQVVHLLTSGLAAAHVAGIVLTFVT